MPALMPGVRPKSSALTMRRLTSAVTGDRFQPVPGFQSFDRETNRSGRRLFGERTDAGARRLEPSGDVALEGRNRCEGPSRKHDVVGSLLESQPVANARRRAGELPGGVGEDRLRDRIAGESGFLDANREPRDAMTRILAVVDLVEDLVRPRDLEVLGEGAVERRPGAAAVGGAEDLPNRAFADPEPGAFVAEVPAPPA